MKRSELISYLQDCGCYKDADLSGVGEWWRNCVNADSCLVPNDKELTVTTCCHIFFELRIDAPFALESDYEVYKLWRDKEVSQIKWPPGM